jgi:predicted amidohydrolase
MTRFTAAVVQWTPVAHDPVAGSHKAARAIAEAAAQGARLVVFPEAWLQCYPYWAGLSVRDPEYQAWREALYRASISVPGPELATVQEAAAQHRCHVVLSAQERAGGTIYAAQMFIGPDGRLLGSHRKLMPTLTERVIWGMGDGSDLDVFDTELGRLGGLLCFEHQMAPARFALCGLNIQLHAASWPGHAFLDPVIDASTRQLAHENACFVFVARDVMSADRVAGGMPPIVSGREFWNAHGGSAIIAPGGEYLVAPVFDREAILTAEIDLDRIAVAKWFVDGAGHYARPDVFRLEWDRRPKPALAIRDAAD